VSFPIKNGGSFHSYVNVYQRVDFLLRKMCITINSVAESPWMKTASRESAVVVREPKLKVDLTKYVEDRDDLVAEVPRFHFFQYTTGKYHEIHMGMKPWYPCSSHQNSWVKMDVHPTKNGIYRY